MTFLVTIEGLPVLAAGADDDLFARLSEQTRKPEAEWKRALAAPQLGRVVLSAERKQEAEQIASRLESAGLHAHVVDRSDGKDALDQAFEATWAEPAGPDGLLFIGPTGEDLRIGSSSIRLIVTGGQLKGGERQHFCVLGLRDSVGAIILRIPGADLSKIVKHAEDPPDVLEAFLEFVSKRAPHAVVERGLEAHTGRLPGLDELGTKDLAHAGVIAAWLLRRFPPQRRAPAPRAAVVAASSSAPMDSPFHAVPGAADSFPPSTAPPQLASLEIATDHRQAARDLQGALPEELRDRLVTQVPPAQQKQQPAVSWRQTLRTPEQEQRRKKLRMIAAAAGAVIVAAIAWSLLHKPASSDRLLHPHEAWKSPYGVTFTYTGGYDAGIADVHDLGFIVDAEKGGDKQTFRIAAHDAKVDRDVFGVRFRLSNWDDTGTRAGWIVVEAHK